MKPIDSAWAILKNPALETMTPAAVDAAGPGFFLGPQGIQGQSGPFMFNMGGRGANRPSTARLLHGLATGQAPRGTKRALAGRAAGTGLGLVNALLAAERAQRGGDIESALGAAYAGYQVPKQSITGAAEGEWSHKPMLDAHGRPMRKPRLDEEGNPILDKTGRPIMDPMLEEEQTPGGAIGGQMEAAQLGRSFYDNIVQEEDPINFPSAASEYGNLPPPKETSLQAGVPNTAPTLGQLRASATDTMPQGDPNRITSWTGTAVDPAADATQNVGLDVFTNSEPMDLAFRMLKGAMR